jgi:RimJ/RimL family protein N-acetyltransferase
MATHAPTDALRVRELTPADVPLLKAYWMNLTASDIDRLSLDPAKIPSRLAQIERYLQATGTPYRTRTSDLLIWELNGAAIGMSSLRNIRFGEYGEIHLHVVEPACRRRGYGHRFFVKSLEEYFRRFELNLIVCEPSSRNPGPNRLLQKLGFTVTRTYRTIPSDVNREHDVNHYEITAALVKAAADAIVS